jgi:hypothetical protein
MNVHSSHFAMGADYFDQSLTLRTDHASQLASEGHAHRASKRMRFDPLNEYREMAQDNAAISSPTTSSYADQAPTFRPYPALEWEGSVPRPPGLPLLGGGRPREGSDPDAALVQQRAYPWSHPRKEPRINIHGGTFIGGNINIQRGGGFNNTLDRLCANSPHLFVLCLMDCLDPSAQDTLENWLRSPPDMSQKQHDTENLRKEGTGNWFLEGDKFVEWKEKMGALWIEGPCKPHHIHDGSYRV